MSVAWNDLEPLVEKQDTYDPDQEEIQQYAQFLGLQLPKDTMYLPLVREGLLAPLPPFWQACQTPSGELLYRNRKTRQIVEENPLDEIYRQKIQQIKRIQGTYGVHEPINEVSALRQSSGIMKISKSFKPDLRLSNLAKNQSQHRPSLIERHITEESQYSDIVSPGESKVKIQKQVPEWQKKHSIRMEKLKTDIMNFFPDQKQLLKASENYEISSQNIDPNKLKQLFSMKQALEKKKSELQRLRQQRRHLQSLCDS